MSRIRKFLSSIGPGIFIIGYVVGTGSVTTMASSGAKYGMSMTWALALSCFFTYIMIVCISRLTILSGNTLIHLIRSKFGNLAAIIIIAGLMITVISSVIGVTAIAADVFQEWTRMLSPGGKGLHPAISAIIIIVILYYLFWFGKHRFFLRAMSVIVALMGISFIGSMFMVIPDASDIFKGMIPDIPDGLDAHLILAGLVGTTMAAIVLLSRTYLVAEQKWTLKDLKIENRDAIISLVMTFLVSAAILAAAAGTMYPRGIVVVKAIDMVKTLEPIAGPIASSVFVIGIIAAAFSSLFPGYLMGPWLVYDYLNLPRNMSRKPVRLAVLGIALLGLIVPVFHGNPVIIMIASQAVSPILMPLLILFVYILINNKKIVRDYKNPLILNIGLGLTFIFSLFMAYTAYIGLSGFLSN
ncbi:MAG: divalent metal cation transporter [Bacteroidales bacterium]|nr:divalent metal cation transporter [Bacteroidales bacterium]